ALGLDLISPPAFMEAVAEGNEPPAAAVAAFQQQVSSKQARVLVFNVQTATAVTTSIEDLARSAGVSVVGISETVLPPNGSFQDWQDQQLDALATALAAAAS